MSFSELESYKRQNPQLAELITELENYLDEILERSVSHSGDFNHAAFDIVPALVAKKLQIDEGYALALLKVFDETGILIPCYHVYCPNTANFLDSFNSVDDLPEYINCPFEERTKHNIDEYFVELVFNFSKVALDHQLALSM